MVKAEWSRRLRSQPAITALANPDILVRLMDETLGQFDALLRTKPTGPKVPARTKRLSSSCQCGLNPLLAYFSTGGAAMAAVAAELSGADAIDCETLRLAWDCLTKREIGLFCGSCRRFSGPDSHGCRKRLIDLHWRAAAHATPTDARPRAGETPG